MKAISRALQLRWGTVMVRGAMMRTSLGVVAGILMLGLLAMPAWGQQPASTDLNAQINGYERAAHSPFVGVPTDWSSSHLIFSAPEPGSDAEDKVQQDPRYWLQQIRRAQFQADDSIDGSRKPSHFQMVRKKNKKTKKVPIKKDWSESLGGCRGQSRRRLLSRKIHLRNLRRELQRLRRLQYQPGGKRHAGEHNRVHQPVYQWMYRAGSQDRVGVQYRRHGIDFGGAVPGRQADGLHPQRCRWRQSGSSAAGNWTRHLCDGAGKSRHHHDDSGSAYVTCKAGAGSCLLSLAFGNGANDTNSSPYYVYGGTNADTIFVGDDTGFCTNSPAYSTERRAR